jgi:isocitrate/isopropylmalate dehydrogenase
MMLDHLGEAKAARDLENAVVGVLKEGQSVTYDLYPAKSAGTDEMASAIVERIRRRK